MINLNKLKENDIYAMLLYAMYKLTGEKGYSTISELMYTLDKNNFMKLCSVFGGCTIKVPTVKEVQSYVKALLLYECLKEGLPMSKAMQKAEIGPDIRKDVLSIYKSIEGALNDYNN